jgi:DNA-binding transcriptional LysR family regulator
MDMMQISHGYRLPDIDLRHLRTFLGLAQIGNFSATGRTLGLSQSAVSRHIGALEISLGVRLFERLGRRAVLTSAGNALRSRLERLAREAESLPRLVADLAVGVWGELRIGASTTPANTIVPAVLGAYRRRFPEVRLALETNNSLRILESLERGAIDLGFVGADRLPSTVSALATIPDELVLIASHRHPFAHKRLVIDDLNDCDFIQRDAGSHTRRLVDHWFHAHRVQPRTLMEVG